MRHVQDSHEPPITYWDRNHLALPVVRNVVRKVGHSTCEEKCECVTLNLR